MKGIMVPLLVLMMTTTVVAQQTPSGSSDDRTMIVKLNEAYIAGINNPYLSMAIKPNTSKVLIRYTTDISKTLPKLETQPYSILGFERDVQGKRLIFKLTEQDIDHLRTNGLVYNVMHSDRSAFDQLILVGDPPKTQITQTPAPTPGPARDDSNFSPRPEPDNLRPLPGDTNQRQPDNNLANRGGQFSPRTEPTTDNWINRQTTDRQTTDRRTVDRSTTDRRVDWPQQSEQDQFSNRNRTGFEDRDRQSNQWANNQRTNYERTDFQTTNNQRPVDRVNQRVDDAYNQFLTNLPRDDRRSNNYERRDFNRNDQTTRNMSNSILSIEEERAAAELRVAKQEQEELAKQQRIRAQVEEAAYLKTQNAITRQQLINGYEPTTAVGYNQQFDRNSTGVRRTTRNQEFIDDGISPLQNPPERVAMSDPSRILPTLSIRGRGANVVEGDTVIQDPDKKVISDVQQRATDSTNGFLGFLLLVSIGLNIYLLWISRGFYVRYSELADELRETFTSTM